MVCGLNSICTGHRWSLPYPPSEVFHLVSVSVVCSLFASYVPKLKHVHAQVLSSHGGRLLPFHGWVSGESDPSAYLCNSGCTYGFSVQGHPEFCSTFHLLLNYLYNKGVCVNLTMTSPLSNTRPINTTAASSPALLLDNTDMTMNTLFHP